MGKKIPAPIIPWQPSTFPDAIVEELNRRKVNRSFKYINESGGVWGKDGEWSKYKGPMTPWVRFCSNGVGREWEKYRDKQTGERIPLQTGIKKGFVLFGGKNFYNEYGFVKNTNGTPESIIGYLPDGIQTHTIDNNFDSSQYPIHVPSPEIEKITVTIQKELFRRASVEWTCFSKAQLEYMTPYFLVPGISCILEWGWNHFDPASLLNLTDIGELKRFNDNPYPLYNKHILKSKGNYDLLLGRITQFEWEVSGNKFKCKTEITSKDRIYAGLSLGSNIVVNTNEKEEFLPRGTLYEFITNSLPLFKQVPTVKGGDPATIPELTNVINYIKKHFPEKKTDPNFRSNGSTWKDYVYGIFYGRDQEEIKKLDSEVNKLDDFDHKSNKSDLWLNLGLVIEIINYFVWSIKAFKNDEMFRIDIDDVVISGHPNLISADGSVLLIPNAEAPKYFNGLYGNELKDISIIGETIKNLFVGSSQSLLNQLRNIDFSNITPKNLTENDIKKREDDLAHSKDLSILDNCTKIISVGNRKNSKKQHKLADYRLNRICRQSISGALRDNLDELINKIRYENILKIAPEFEFPFLYNRDSETGSKPYPARYSGYLKNLYVNIECLKKIVKEATTYTEFIDKLLRDISKSAGSFWDLRLVDATGQHDIPDGSPATMKIVDYRFIETANTGTPFTFDYFDADSLLLGVGFKPILSDAQAIRTIYANTNRTDKNVIVVNDTNELLDYKFRDRLAEDDIIKGDKSPTLNREFADTMRRLQQIKTGHNSYQMTNRGSDGKIIIRRLAIPGVVGLLELLLDDGDEEFNPKYTGIMQGIQANFTIQGIGGLRTFMMFLVRNLPEPYSHENVIFRIVDVQEVVEAGKWITTITAGLIPLREHIKERLGLPSNPKIN